MIGPLSKGTDFELVPDDSGKPVGRMLHRLAEREEFFVSGTCGRCWDRMFSGEEEEP